MVCDQTAVRYLVKSVFSGVTLAFSFYMIASNKDPCNANMAYWTGLVGTVVGSFVEQGTQHLGSAARGGNPR